MNNYLMLLLYAVGGFISGYAIVSGIKWVFDIGD